MIRQQPSTTIHFKPSRAQEHKNAGTQEVGIQKVTFLHLNISNLICMIKKTSFFLLQGRLIYSAVSRPLTQLFFSFTIENKKKLALKVQMKVLKYNSSLIQNSK